MTDGVDERRPWAPWILNGLLVLAVVLFLYVCIGWAPSHVQDLAKLHARLPPLGMWACGISAFVAHQSILLSLVVAGVVWFNLVIAARHRFQSIVTAGSVSAIVVVLTFVVWYGISSTEDLIHTYLQGIP